MKYDILNRVYKLVFTLKQTALVYIFFYPFRLGERAFESLYSNVLLNNGDDSRSTFEDDDEEIDICSLPNNQLETESDPWEIEFQFAQGQEEDATTEESSLYSATNVFQEVCKQQQQQQ